MIGQFETNMDVRTLRIKETAKLKEKTIKEAEETAAKALANESKS